MSGYDGEVRIKTKVDTSQMQRLQIQIDKAMNKAEGLKNKYDELGSKKIPTDDYKEVQRQIDATQARLDKLLAKRESFRGSHKSASWLNMNAEIEELQNSLPYMKGELQDLVDTGKAFRLGTGTEEYQKLGNDLNMANKELAALVTKQEELNGKSGRLAGTLKKTAAASKKLFSTMDKGTKKSGGLFKSFASRLKGITMSLLIFNWISKGFNAMVSGMKEGYQNLVQYSDKYNKSASAMMSANTQLKNSFATAWAPLMELAMPYLIQFVGWLTEGANRVAQFVAALTGAKTWTKAIAVQQDYAGSLNGTAAAAKKAVRALAGFDELNVLNKADISGGAIALNPSDMFTEVEISNEAAKSAAALMEWFKKLQQAIKPFTDALKDLWEGGLSKLGNFAWTGLKDFYNEFLVPLGQWAFGTQDEGFTRLINIINDDLNRIPWDTVNTNLWAFWKAIEPYAEQFGEGLIDFFEDVADLATDVFIFLFGEDGAVTWLTDWLNNNDPETARQWGYALGVLVTGLLGFKALSGVIGTLGGLKNLGVVTLLMGLAVPEFEFGKILGKINFLEDKDYYDNFRWLGDGGFFDTVMNTDFDSQIEALGELGKVFAKLFAGPFDFGLESILNGFTDEQMWKNYGELFKNNFDMSMGWMEEAGREVGAWFQGVLTNFSNGYDEFSGWWYENAPLKFIRVWFEDEVIPYFKEEKWKEQFEIIQLVAEIVWKEFLNWWNESAIGKWCSENKDTWFSLDWWGKMLADIPKAFEIAFDAAVEWAKEAIKGLISWIGENLTIGKIFRGVSDLMSGYTDNYNSGLGGGGNRRSYDLYGVSVDDLPHYANGAVFRGGNPYAAIVNDQPFGQTNIEAPMDTIKQGLRNVLSEFGSGGEYTFVAQIDGREIFRETVKQDRMYCKSTGHSAFID